MAFLNPENSARARERPLSDAIGQMVARFGAAASVVLAGVVGLGLVMAGGTPGWGLLAGVAFFISGVLAATSLLRQTYPHRALGLCNLVTLFRLGLVATLVVTLVSGGGNPWMILGVSVLALSLDGVDGWFARREGLVSGFGARFDMEVDSAFAMVLALHSFVSGTAGALVLLLGVPRYVFLGAGIVWPWLLRDLPERFSRKAVCVVQLAALIVLQVPFTPDWTAALIVPVAVAALVWSFGRDVVWLWRARS